SHTTTRHKGNERAKLITPPSKTAFEEDNDLEQDQRDKDMQKNLALITNYFKKIYKPTNNHLRTSSNSRNKNVDTTPRYKNDDHLGQFENQRTMNVAGAREKVGSLVVQQSRIQFFNCKEYEHFAKECKKPKRVKDSAYHKEKMLLCKQAEQEAHSSYMAKIQEVSTAKTGTDSEPVEQVQNDAGYNVFANDLQHSEHFESISNTCLVEMNDSNVIPNSPGMCEDDIQNDQNDVERDDERVALANLIVDLKLDVDENKKIQKQLKKANTTLAQELQECKAILAETIVYKRSQSIQTIHMLAPKVPTYNGRPTFANPRYVKQAQSEIPCLYAFPYDQSTHANRLIPDREETLVLKKESRSKLNKDLVRPYDYTTLNSLYEIFKPPTQEYEIHLAHANEIRRKIWQKSFVKSKQNIYKNIGFLPVSNSISKTRQAYNVMTNNINHFKEIIDNARIKHSKDQFRAPTAQDMEILILTSLMPLATKTLNDSFRFVHVLKKEMHADLKYVESLEKEIDKLESHKAEFSNMYDVKNDTVWNEKASNEFRKEREQYVEIQDLKAQLQDKNIAISELKKLIEKGKRKSVDTKFDRPSVVRQPNAQRIPKLSVLGKTTPFSNSLKRIYIPKTMSVPKANVSEGVNHNTNVSRPQHKSNQLRDKVVPNNSQVKVKMIQVEVHPRILSVSYKMKYVTACKDMYNSRTLNANAVCATSRFGNDQFAPILGYGDMVQGNVTINRVYYVEGLNHNLFLVGQFCDADLEVAFRKSTCFVRDLKGKDLLTGNYGSDLYTISLQESTSSTPLCLMAKASPTQACLWHRRLSHLNFDYINLLSKKDIVIGLPKLKYVKDQLCSSCDLSQAKRSSFKSKVVLSSKGRLNLLHMDLCGPMRVASINGKKYILKKNKHHMMNLPIHSMHRHKKLMSLLHTTLEELHQFDRLQVWELVDKPFGKTVKRLKWLWKYKKDEGQTEEVYVAQPDGFVDPDHPEKVYRLRKALYGLKQAPMAWYVELSKFLTSKGFTKGLQIHQSLCGIFINQAKYTLKILLKHGMEKGQSIGTPMATKPKIDANLNGNPIDQTHYGSKIRSLMYLTSSRPIKPSKPTFQVV
nr:integrase, catalytic region, zinc finger, CCHC-type, peptidase aspartic, catalytic [Tanacetum cinerariifolium]